MIYVDASALVALLVLEPVTPQLKIWFSGNTEALVSADWVAVEFASALAAKQRARQLRAAYARAAYEALEALTASEIRLAPVSRSAFLRAADLCKSAASGLRSGDALHLAVAQELGANQLLGLDATMNAAAKKLGMNLVL